MEDHEKINAILKGLKYAKRNVHKSEFFSPRYMKDNCEEMNVKLINIEREQNYFHEVSQKMFHRLLNIEKDQNYIHEVSYVIFILCWMHVLKLSN